MYRTVAQLDALTATLATSYPSYFQRFTLPETSVQNRAVHGLRMRVGAGPERGGVLIVGGTHARELMNPDAIVELAIDLLEAHRRGTDVVHGGRRWPQATIDAILRSLDLWLVPCINPDGREYVLTADDMWRKNRRDNPGSSCDGVDLNRNADILWGVTQGQTSCSPCSAVYCGSAVFSEPEGRNVRYLLDNHPIVSFVDVHSFSELVLWPWGHAPNQSTDPRQNFTTLPTGTCSTIQVRNYKEYLHPRDADRHQRVGAKVAEAIAEVRGRRYTNQPALVLYPTTGAQSDYAYARHIADPTKRKTYGFTIETGPDVGDPRESFHPRDPEPIKLDAKSGLIALIQQSIDAIELIGNALDQGGTAQSLAQIRDEVLSASEAGRAWITLIERMQPALAEALLGDGDLTALALRAYERTGVFTAAPDSEEITAADVALAQDALDRVVAWGRSPELATDLASLVTLVRTLRGATLTRVVESMVGTAPRPGQRPRSPRRAR